MTFPLPFHHPGVGGGDPVNFPVVEGTPTASQANSDATPTITLPSGVATGELVIAMIGVDAGVTVSWPGSWVELHDDAGGATLSTAYLIASGGETTVTPTLSSSADSVAISYRISTYSDVPVAATAWVGSATTVNPPALTSGFGVVKTLYLAFGVVADNNNNMSAAPTNYSGYLESNNSNQPIMSSSQRAYESASDDPSTFTGSWGGGKNQVTQTIAIKGI